MSQEHKYNKNILYLSYDGLTDPLGQSQIIPYLAGLSDIGYHITIISTEKAERFETNKAIINTVLQSKSIDWCPLRYTKKPPVLSTIFDIWKISKAACKLYHQQPFQIVHCRSYVTSIVGLKLKKRFGIKFIFDMRGFWADERVDGGVWKLSNPLFLMVYSYFKRKEKKFIAQSDHVVSLTQSGVEAIKQHVFPQLSMDKISVIPCCADLNHFSISKNTTQNRTHWRNKLSIPENSFVLTYLGSLGTWYLIDEMVRFFNVLRTQFKPDAVFLIITQDDPKIATDAFQKHQIPADSFRLTISGRNELPAMLSASDAAVSFIKPAFSKKASSPTKLAELLGMGIPVFSNTNVGDIDLYYSTIPNLKVTDFGDDSFFAKWSAFFSNDLTQYNQNNYINFANHYFSLNSGIEKYTEIYKKL